VKLDKAQAEELVSALALATGHLSGRKRELVGKLASLIAREIEKPDSAGVYLFAGPLWSAGKRMGFRDEAIRSRRGDFDGD